MSEIENTRDQSEIVKKIMQQSDLKPHGKFINQTITKILKNVGKYSKISLSTKDELIFFNDIKPIVQKKYGCSVEIIIEKGQLNLFAVIFGGLTLKTYIA